MNLVQVKRVDGSAYSVTDAQLRLIHGSMDYNDQVASVSSGSVTGEMKEADAGIWYLVLDYGTNNTLWLDHGETLQDPYVDSISGSDGDRDGFDEEYIKLDFSGLPDLTAGESQKEVEVKLVFCPARTASITFTSLTNSSSIGASAYTYEITAGYTGGFTEGDLGSIAKIKLDFSASGNETYPDSEYFKLVHYKLGAYTFTSTTFGDYDTANKRYQVKFGDQVNRQGGKDLYYAKNAGDLWATYELKAYCKFPANQTIRVTISHYCYKPDGTLTSAFSRTVDFSSW